MSKINQMQRAALQSKTTIVAKTDVAKATPDTKVEVKTAVVKPVAPKAVAAKPSVTKTIAKPVTTKASPSESKKDSKQDKAKPRKAKMERDSFTMPKEEYAQIALLKACLLALGQPTKKSELLRAGIKLLAAMSDNTLKTTLAAIPVIKTGRPNSN